MQATSIAGSVILAGNGCAPPPVDDAETKPPVEKAAEPDTFVLKADPDISLLRKTDRVDLNLGTTPKVFVAAVWKQLTGKVATPEMIAEKAALLGTETTPRRIDLALLLAEEAGVSPKWKYSDPWEKQITLSGAPDKKLERDVGMVFMFFFTSPNKPNGGPGWSNNHSPGMYDPDEWLMFEGHPEDSPTHGYYHPENPGYWYQELKDLRYAGVDFILPNVYGPDINDAKMGALNAAIERLREEDGDNIVKIGMFDDTWTWGQPWFGPFWEVKPDCNDVEATAKLLFEAKWKPFFSRVPRDLWYTVDGRPVIYYYNNNTLQNRENFDNVLPEMKRLFAEEFGVEPWVAVDTAFNYRPSMKEVSDSHFRWYTFDLDANYASETRNDITLTHSMVRWDSTSRWNDHVEARAKPGDLLAKDDEILKRVLNQTRDHDMLVIATWNDLGEGTGINRCYDYFWDGEWKKPTHFMDLIRRSQEGEVLD